MRTFPDRDTTDQSLIKPFSLNVQDFVSLSRGLVVQNSDVKAEDPLIQGVRYSKQFRSGLSLTCRDAMEEHPFIVDSTHAAGLSCVFFARGHITARIGDRDFLINPDQTGAINALVVYHSDDESFQRVTHEAQSVQHLVVYASPEWLEENGISERLIQHVRLELAKYNMAFRQWTAGPELQNLVAEFFSPSISIPELLDMYLEARALDIVSQTLSAFLSKRFLEQSALLSRHDHIRLQRAKELIQSAQGYVLNVNVIAQHAGVSNSGLQRLFRKAENCSVSEYVREVRLDNAVQLLKQGDMSVKEVSVVAGYSSPANFATAFKRKFGVAPKQMFTALF